MTTQEVDLTWSAVRDDQYNIIIGYESNYGKYSVRVTVGELYGKFAYKVEITKYGGRDKVSAISNTLREAKQWTAHRIWKAIHLGNSLTKSDKEWEAEMVAHNAGKNDYFAKEA